MGPPGPGSPALLERVRALLVESGEPPTPGAVARAVRRTGVVLGDETVMAVIADLRAEIVGAGVLEPLLRDPAVSDVLVNGVHGVWVDRGAGAERTDVRVGSPAAVRSLAVRLAAAAGRRLDDAQPWVDARLVDGTRLHAVLPPLAPDGPCISLRVAGGRRWRFDELLAAGSVTAELAVLLRGLVARRQSFLVTGGTGTGKTTVLGALLGLVDPSHRLVVVEEGAELRPDHPHVVRLEAQPANVEGAGAVGLPVLVRQALRMRPDRLVVGEVRGAEVADLLAALNTGHEGGCGTVHANDMASLPARVEALALPTGMTRSAVHAQLAAGVSAVVHVARSAGGRRRVAALGRLVAGSSGVVEVVPACAVDEDGGMERGSGYAWARALVA